MEVSEYLKTKLYPTDPSRLSVLNKELKKWEKEKNYTQLSKESIALGILLLNGLPEDDENKKNAYYENFWVSVSENTKLFTALEKIFGKKIPVPMEKWAEFNDLWVYFYGEEFAKIIPHTLEIFKNVPYQEGYYRRSFTAPNKHKLYFCKQFNFLNRLVNRKSYDMSLEEHLTYLNHIYAYDTFEYIFAGAIYSGNEYIYNILLDITYNRHQTTKAEKATIKAMFLSNRPDAWEAVIQLLLSAQRQEGLRQTILECLDETNLGAMKAVIKVILDEKLTRFSSVVRALDVWTGLGWEAQKESTIIRFMELAYRFLDKPQEIAEATQSKDNAEVFMALWTQGIYDVEKCFSLIDDILAKGDNEKILLALYFVSLVNLEEYTLKYALKTIENEDLAVLSKSLLLFGGVIHLLSKKEKDEIFVKLENRLPKIPEKEQKFEGKVFSWLNFTIQKTNVFDIMLYLIDFEDEKEWDKILIYYDKVSADQRYQICNGIIPYEMALEEYYEKGGILNKKQRDFAFDVLKDRSTSVQQRAMDVLSFCTFEQEELPIFLETLNRKSANTRIKIIEILLKLETNSLQKSIELLLKGSVEQRLAGLDLITQAKIKNLLEKNWIEITTKNHSEFPKITAQEKIIVDKLLDTSVDVLSFTQENGFGLFNPNIKTPYQIPQIPTKGKYVEQIKKYQKDNAFGLSQSPEKINKALESLKKLFLDNKNYEYSQEYWDKSVHTELLGNAFNTIKYDIFSLTPEQKFENYPLHELWAKWATDHQLTPLDLMLIQLGSELGANVQEAKEEQENEEEELEADEKKQLKAWEKWEKSIWKKFEKMFFFPKIPKNLSENQWYNPIQRIIDILPLKFPYQEKQQFLEGFIKTIFGTMSQEELNIAFPVKNYWQQESYYTWRNITPIIGLYNKYLSGFSYNEEDISESVSENNSENNAENNLQSSKENFDTYWQLKKWNYETLPQAMKNSDDWQARQYKLGFDDVIRAYHYGLTTKDELMTALMTNEGIAMLTHTPKKEDEKHLKKDFPFLEEFVNPLRNRILEIELKRGDTDTAVTHLANSLSEVYGIDYFIQIITGLGLKNSVNKGCGYLLKRCYPLKNETQETFNKKIKKTDFPEKRLAEVATYAPQWVSFIQKYLGWENMDSAIWWLHAHTNGYHSAETETEIAKYSKVEIEQFKEGAVDKEWFEYFYPFLGADKWKLLYEFAKHVSDGNGHTRAKLYADAILGNITLAQIHDKVKDKRNQDYLRVYGLVELDTKNRDKDMLQRYQYLQKFKKESKQFGSQRQASEALAMSIAMDNLARNAGFSDPIRLTWAMETEEALDIIEKAKVLEFGEVIINLVIDEHGQADIICKKGDKTLKDVPANLKKEEKIIELKSFVKTLQEQYKRTRKSLESAMIAGDAFMIAEIQNLMRHPVVSPLLKKLVLKSNNGLGFWQEGKLIDPNNNKTEPKENIVIAHCADLFESKTWGSFQKYCFDNELKQPFKQIFREFYTPTADELKEKAISRRYAGHQVQPKKTVALLKSQGWTLNYDEGLQKVFHKEGLIAKIYAMADWFSPSDVESPTLETAEFINKKTWQNMPFEEINPRIFSEVMRDLDLVVSVAHVGETDPEASQSSIELRTAIITETLRLFKITNVDLKGTHALIKGTKGDYSVHLGSAIAHKIAGSSLNILPVHSQHRGRMFLPFLDEDPRTAEIVSKIILLAKDNEIQDPTILKQII